MVLWVGQCFFGWDFVKCLFFIVGGGGGKGTWGKNGEVYEDDEFDPNDPNYDSDTAKVKTIKFFFLLYKILWREYTSKCCYMIQKKSCVVG